MDKIDLHIHTNLSDGTDTPEELLKRIQEKGMNLFSVTDHDSVKSSMIIPGLLKEGDKRYLSGVEFSCEDEKGKYHILGYGYDPHSEGIQKVVKQGHALRMEKLQARLDFLRVEMGVEFPDEAIEYLYSLDNPGKPHIGNLMVKYGYTQTKEEAIKDYINKFQIPNRHVRPEDAITGIIAGGGIPVLAHPSYGDGDQLIIGDAMDERLRYLLDLGLQGLEGFYSGFTRKLQAEVLALAEKYGMYVTAGSDYHGSNKLVRLGDTGLDKAGEWPDGLKRFLAFIMASMSRLW